jgi:hypothetical protein
MGGLCHRVHLFVPQGGGQASAHHEEADLLRPAMDVTLVQIVVNERYQAGPRGSEQKVGEWRPESRQRV